MTRDEIKAAVLEAMQEHATNGYGGYGVCRHCCDTCDLDQNEHRDHHQALRGAFSVRRQAVNTVVKLLAGGLALWLGLAVWEYFKIKANGK